MSSCRIQWVWLTNLLIVLSLVVFITVANLGVLSFPKMGFYCGDPKISHKFNGESVTPGILFAGALIPPLIVMSLVEWIRVRGSSGLTQALRWYGQYAFGILMLIFVIEATKSIISEPRPHFLDTCRPKEAINCTTAYVAEYKCSNPNTTPYQQQDSIRSFPSGHSAMGFYTSLYLIMYLHKRTPDDTTLLVPWLQCLTVVWAVFCGLSRITDRRHHWWDVAIGALVGLSIASYVAKRLSRNFRGSEEDSGSETSRKTYSTRRLLSSTSSYSPPDEKTEKTLS